MNTIPDSPNAVYMLTNEQLQSFGQQCADKAVQRIKDMLRRHSEMQVEPLYRKSEVAKIFGVNTRTIDNWIASGIINPTRIGAVTRIDRNEIVRIKENFTLKTIKL